MKTYLRYAENPDNTQLLEHLIAEFYRMVQKIFPPVWNSRLISAKKNGQPMHSQLALTEHVSLNLAPLILLDPVQCSFRRLCVCYEQKTNRLRDHAS